MQIVLGFIGPVSEIPLEDSEKWQKQNVPFLKGIISTGDAGTLQSLCVILPKVQMREDKHVDTIISIIALYSRQ